MINEIKVINAWVEFLVKSLLPNQDILKELSPTRAEVIGNSDGTFTWSMAYRDEILVDGKTQEQTNEEFRQQRAALNEWYDNKCKISDGQS